MMSDVAMNLYDERMIRDTAGEWKLELLVESLVIEKDMVMNIIVL